MWRRNFSRPSERQDQTSDQRQTRDTSPTRGKGTIRDFCLHEPAVRYISSQKDTSQQEKLVLLDTPTREKGFLLGGIQSSDRPSSSGDSGSRRDGLNKEFAHKVINRIGDRNPSELNNIVDDTIRFIKKMNLNKSEIAIESLKAFHRAVREKKISSDKIDITYDLIKKLIDGEPPMGKYEVALELVKVLDKSVCLRDKLSGSGSHSNDSMGIAEAPSSLQPRYDHPPTLTDYLLSLDVVCKTPNVVKDILAGTSQAEKSKIGLEFVDLVKRCSECLGDGHSWDVVCKTPVVIKELLTGMPQPEKTKVALELVDVLKRCSMHLGDELRDTTDLIGYLGKEQKIVAEKLIEEVLSKKETKQEVFFRTINVISELGVAEIAPQLENLLWEDHIRGELEKRVRETIKKVEVYDLESRVFDIIQSNKNSSDSAKHLAKEAIENSYTQRSSIETISSSSIPSSTGWEEIKHVAEQQRSDDEEKLESQAIDETWLGSPGGGKWLKTKEGWDWLEKPGGKKWLEKDGGKKWLDSNGGKQWLDSGGGKKWSQEEERRRKREEEERRRKREEERRRKREEEERRRKREEKEYMKKKKEEKKYNQALEDAKFYGQYGYER